MRLVSKILMKIRIEMFECKGGIVSVLLLFTALLFGPHLRFDEIGAYQETLNRFRTANLGRSGMRIFVNLASRHLRQSAGEFGWLVYM